MDEVENPDVTAAGQTVPTLEDGEELIASGPSPTSPTAPGREDTSGENPTVVVKDPPDIRSLDIGIQRPAPLPPSQPPSGAGTFKPPLPKDRVALPTRPVLKREASAPRPIAPPPPAPIDIPDSPRDPPDSLTLAELRRIREGFPPSQPKQQELALSHKVYDYEYDDTQGFITEVEEWFAYNTDETLRISVLPDIAKQEWEGYCEITGQEVTAWSSSDGNERFIEHLLEGEARGPTIKALGCLCYFALGCYGDTAGKATDAPFGLAFKDATSAEGQQATTGLHIKTIIRYCHLLLKEETLDLLLNKLTALCDRDLDVSLQNTAEKSDGLQTHNDKEVSEDLWYCMTLIHMLFEVARLNGDTAEAQEARVAAGLAAPKFLTALTKIIGRLRWDEAAPVPISKLFTLHWKAVLLAFGGINDVTEVKAHFKDPEDEKDVCGKPVITASPLDYHLFRQEISSKYPAYQPPKTLFPIEPENNSILPPLRQRQSRYDSDRSQIGTAPMPIGQTSIMHQPVHIATPAPSPPPSPAGPGGKGGKKQNYQTNQMFPFLYPPLDDNSNDIGGRGSTELQDALVGKKWQGSDVPTSILEAAELFARRMRATRAMKQLWEARVDYMKYDRGWRGGEDFRQDLDDVDIGEAAIGLSKADGEIAIDRHESKDAVRSDKNSADPRDDIKQESEDDSDNEDDIYSLTEVAEFYQESLPVLQSFIIVALKAVLKQVTDLVTKDNKRPSQTNGYSQTNGVHDQPPVENGIGNSPESDDTLDDLDNLRTQEITCKAITGSILLLLKWFKVSHILRYEYLTQLLLDSNYIPLVLKLWQTQDIGRACHYSLDRHEHNFFIHCARQFGSSSSNQSAGSSPSSPDSAAPPPIKLARRASSPSSANLSNSSSPTDYTTHPPELDELGYPITPLPSSPITSFSWRNTTTAINHLRILQKVTRRKAHRSLLLVSYKSSNHLKKSLRIPIKELRYYTLKLFKSQVPYCGRKWRQSNMKIITAVWLSVPAELRDDWLVGGGGGMGGQGPGDVDGTVEEALPLEQSMRALTYWWNCRNYPDEMGKDAEGGFGRMEEERGFFEREIEKMEGMLGRVAVDDEAEEEGGEWGQLVDGY